MNRHHMNTPLFPGAMTPAQILHRDITKAASIIATAATVAAFCTMFIMFN